jgi:hypothetical protein
MNRVLLFRYIIIYNNFVQQSSPPLLSGENILWPFLGCILLHCREFIEKRGLFTYKVLFSSWKQAWDRLIKKKEYVNADVVRIIKGRSKLLFLIVL